MSTLIIKNSPFVSHTRGAYNVTTVPEFRPVGFEASSVAFKYTTLPNNWVQP